MNSLAKFVRNLAEIYGDPARRYETPEEITVEPETAPPFPGHHVGRSVPGPVHPMERNCPCPTEPCGLVSEERAEARGDCPQHSGSETMRQRHRADRCPGVSSTAPDRARFYQDRLEELSALLARITAEPTVAEAALIDPESGTDWRRLVLAMIAGESDPADVDPGDAQAWQVAYGSLHMSGQPAGGQEPLGVLWDGDVVHPRPGNDTTVVCCTTSDGRSAVLLLGEEYREALRLALVDPNGDGEPAPEGERLLGEPVFEDRRWGILMRTYAGPEETALGEESGGESQ